MGSGNDSENIDRGTAGGWRAPRFTDELIRPFVLTTASVVTLVQLVEQSPSVLTGLTWGLVAVVVAVAITTVFPLRRLSDQGWAALVSGFAVSGGLVFALAPSTAAVSFVFMASAIAGEKLASRQAAFAVAGIGTAVSAAATWAAETMLHVPEGSPWWLSLTVGLPVYMGIARRERADTLAAAELAAVQSKRAAASEAREAALEERGRIAREIHDVLGHSLSGIAMQLDMADALHTEGRDKETNEAMGRARALAVSGVGETRRAIHALREDTLPLAESVANLAESNSAGFEVRGKPGDVRVEAAQAVIRAAQEAITNAYRHAPGAEVRLLLEYGERIIRLTVTDTGAPAPGGTGPGAVGRQESPGNGMGLVGMRERASLLDGTLRAGPTGPPGHGWTVGLELPR